MQKIKILFGAISFVGFFILLGTAGMSDLEMETGQRLLSSNQFSVQILVGMAMFLFGFAMCKINFNSKLFKKIRFLAVTKNNKRT